MKIALVHDWLTGMRGGENVLLELCKIFPNAIIYTLFYNSSEIDEKIKGHDIKVSSLNNIFGVKKYYRNLVSLFPRAIESFNFNEFDLVISTSHAVAKGILTPPSTLHISYIHSPMRWAWDLREYYFGSPEVGWLWHPKRNYIQKTLFKLRSWDVLSAHRVDHYIANSINTAKKIKKYWNKESIVIYPPVNTKYFSELSLIKFNDWVENKKIYIERKEFYLVVSSFVPYKKTQLAIDTAKEHGFQLIIAGSGPLYNSLKKSCAKHSNIVIILKPSKAELKLLYENAKALIYPQEEDFGIIPLEAQAAGLPVLAYGKGGALETIRDKVTGLFFYNQKVQDLIECIQKFENNVSIFDVLILKEQAEKFSDSVFSEKILKFINQKILEK